MKYQVIVADPPWKFGDELKSMKKKTKRSAISNYSVMDIEEIKALPISDLADKNGSILALWIPSILLPAGFDIMSCWGFQFKQTFIWIKTKKHVNQPINDPNDSLAFGMGRLFRNCHEIALIGTRGKVYKMLENKSQRSVSLDANFVHSKKPDTLQDRLSIMFPTANKIEIFSRREKDGWCVLGNQIDGKDIREAIQEKIDE